jgi:aspartate-semialdehyde dehydrogenase
MSGYRVAILGATGLVGREFMKVLEQRAFPISELRLLASERSAGRTLSFQGDELPVEEASDHSFDGIDLALFSAGASASRHFAPIAAEAGALVIDNSSAWRMDEHVPLVVPEVNGDDAQHHSGIIANPNCSTIQMVVALYPIHKVARIKRIVVSTYQSVSGTGSQAVDELLSQSRLVLEGQPPDPKVYPHQIAFNLIPEIDIFLENGYSKEEWKMVQETRKIMHEPDLPVSATAVRVPVLVGHSEAVTVELEKKMTADEARAILAGAPGVVVMDSPSEHIYPTPAHVAGRDEVFVGRIREDVSHPSGLVMWIVSDNLRKGAALNAVQIAEYMIAKGWL